MSEKRHERVIEEGRRLRVVRWYYALHGVVVVAVVAGLLIRNGAPENVGAAVGIGVWLGSFATSSVLLITGGLLGVLESTTTVMTIKFVAAVVALGSGFLLYGLGLVTTPVLLIAGGLLRWAVIRAQRLFGVRRADATAVAAAAI